MPTQRLEFIVINLIESLGPVSETPVCRPLCCHASASVFSFCVQEISLISVVVQLVGMEGISYPGQDVQRSDQTIHRSPFGRVCAHGVPGPEWTTVDSRAVPCRQGPRCRHHMLVSSWVHVAGAHETPAASKPQGLADAVQLLWDAGHAPLISPSLSSPPSLISFIPPPPHTQMAQSLSTMLRKLSGPGE